MSVGGDFTLRAKENYGLQDVKDDDDNVIGQEYILHDLWGLNCLAGISGIGGNVNLINFNLAENRLNWGAGGEWNKDEYDSSPNYGLCWLRSLIDELVIDYACNDVTVIGAPRTIGGSFVTVDFSDPSRTPCSDGLNPSAVAPIPLPDKDLSCYNSVKEVVEAPAQASTFIDKDGILNIDSEIDLAKIELFTIDGKSVLNLTNVAAGLFTYPVNLSTGIYIVKLTAIDNSVEVYKVAK